MLYILSSVTFFKDIIYDTKKAIASAENCIDMLEIVINLL